MMRLTSLAAFSVTVIGIGKPRFRAKGNATAKSRTNLPLSLYPSRRSRDGLGRRLLALVVLDCRLDGVLGQDGTMDLDRRQVQFLDDGRVANVRGFVERPAL